MINTKSLNYRFSLLLNEEDYGYLNNLARKRNVSVGKLIRTAIYRVWFDKADRQKQQKAFRTIVSKRKILSDINYQDLINEGRRF